MSDLVLNDFQNFYHFIKNIILPYEPASNKLHSDFHIALMKTACEPQSATAASRGSLKSTILARYRPLHRLVDPTEGTNVLGKIDTVILSETSTLACEHLDWIKNSLLRNHHLIGRYGHLADPTKNTWSEDEIELIDGNKCTALGYRSQVRGRHPTDIVVDDLESLDNMGTEESLKKLKDWFYRVLMGAMVPETRLTVIGTIISKKSLLTELVNKEEFKGRIWKALIEKNGILESLWPQRWPVEYLLKRKKSLGVHRFNAEYQNEPLGSGDPIVWPEWIVRHTENDIPLNPRRIYIAVDPAFTEERWGDYSAITVMFESDGGKLFEKVAWRKKVASPELIKTIRGFYYHYQSLCPNDIYLGIEEVAAQKFLRQAIQDLDPNMVGKITPMRPDKDKARRLIDVSRYFEYGTVSLKTESLIDELLAFPSGDKDRVDSLVYTLKLYEQHHQTPLDSTYEVLDPTEKMSQTETEIYMDKVNSGLVKAPQKLLKKYREAQMIMRFFDE